MVGCGRIAELGYAPALGATTGFELRAVVDPDPARRGLLADATGATAHPSVGELLAAGAPEAAVVCGPVATHVAALEELSAAGARCLVEKPPAPDAAGAARIAELDPPVSVAFNRRFDQGAAALAAIPPDASALDVDIEIGYRRGSWRPLGDLGDAWADLGPHLADLALLLLGGGAEVTDADLTPREARVVVRSGRGSARLRAAIDVPHRERLTVSADGGARRVVSATPGPVRALARRLRGVEHPLVATLREQLRAFAAACRGDDSAPLATAADGVRAMRLVDAARAANGVGGAA
jgi:predicted dehydrogenase